MADDLTNGEFFNKLENARNSTDNMIDFYNDTAIKYDDLMAESQYDKTIRFTCETLRQYLGENDAKVASDVKVMDVGCGSGLSGVFLKNSGFQNIVGVDASQGMLEKAKLLDIYKSLKQGKLTETEKLDFESSSFDCLLCCGCISVGHIVLEHAIHEFIRLLKDGGIAVYTVSPTVSQTQILEEHLKYVNTNQCEILRMEKRFYLYADGKKVDCTVMVIKKLKH